jgi:hypothetical protein
MRFLMDGLIDGWMDGWMDLFTSLLINEKGKEHK